MTHPPAGWARTRIPPSCHSERPEGAKNPYPLQRAHILTLEDFRRRTHQEHHAFGGVPPVMGNSPPAHKTPIENLWFIGAQSESAGGVTNVMVGAQKVVKRIMSGE